MAVVRKAGRWLPNESGNPKGKRRGTLDLGREIRQALGQEGEELLGQIFARALLTRRLIMPRQAELMEAGCPTENIPQAETLSVSEYLSIAMKFVRLPTEGEELPQDGTIIVRLGPKATGKAEGE